MESFVNKSYNFAEGRETNNGERTRKESGSGTLVMEYTHQLMDKKDEKDEKITTGGGKEFKVVVHNFSLRTKLTNNSIYTT